MGRFKYIAINMLETFLRVLPFRTKTGSIRIGNPDRNSPVLLTCNFHLTVERVKKALEGIDAYLLVANSKGINVWCAATGGMLTNHDVVSVLKTSGVELLVDHREVILPQLAATGIDGKVIRQKTGRKVIWGPADVIDVPSFLKNNKRKTPEMKEVKFPPSQRIEMAVAWAFPISVVFGLILLLFWTEAIIPVILIIWGLSFLIFITFPWYRRWLQPKTKRVGFVFFDFGRGGIQLILLGILIAALVGIGHVAGHLSLSFVLRWGTLLAVVVLTLSIDLMGSTPLYKSGLHKDRWLEIVIDEDKCKGSEFCEQVCPRNCYKVDEKRRLATRPRGHLCVQCGACIVQCPFDSLFFESPDGEVILPDTVRKFKLNMMGTRSVSVGAE